VIGGQAFSTADVLAVIDRATAFGLSPRVRSQVRAVLDSGDSRDALIDALVEYLSGHVKRALVEFAAGSLGPTSTCSRRWRNAGNVPASGVSRRVNGDRSTVTLVPS
jgi:hypothetical protein